LLTATVQARGRENVQESAVPVKQHGNKLDEDYYRKENKKCNTERLEMLFFCAALLWYANVQCILQCTETETLD